MSKTTRSILLRQSGGTGVPPVQNGQYARFPVMRQSVLKWTLLSAALALSLAALSSFLMEVRGLSIWGSSSPSVPLDLAEAIACQCAVSGNDVISTGTDSKLVWDCVPGSNAHVDIDLDVSRNTLLEVFWGTPEQQNFSPDRRLALPLPAGRCRRTFFLPGRICRLRLDFGQEPGLAFRVHSAVVREGVCFARPWSWRTFLLRTAVLAFPCFLLFLHLVFPVGAIWTFIDRNRFALAAGVLAFFVIFELSGTSIGMWNRYVANEAAKPPLFGTERQIRSDEWAVFAPLTIAQASAHPAWPYFNDIPRAMPTDMFSVYAQPVRHFLVAFRPFLAGYVLLGFNRGLAFFWAGRWLALLLVLYELLKLLTDGDRILSGVGAALGVLAPVIQWWGAINALAEMLISGSLFILCLDRFLRETSLRNRWLPIVGMGYSAVAYAMTLYPAAMVSLAYVFAALSAWVTVRHAKDFRCGALTASFAIIVVFAATMCLAWYLTLSRDAFLAVQGTVYPGQRLHCGGGFWKGFGLSWGNLFFPWTSPVIEDGNSFNRSVFLDFFPLGYVMAALLFLKRRVLDLPSMFLAAVAILLGVYCAIGFPEWAAKASMLWRSTPPRAFVAVSFAQFLLLIRSVSLIREETPSVRLALPLAACMAATAFALARSAFPAYLSNSMLAAITAVALVGNYLFLRFPARKEAAVAFFAGLALCAGAFVNPIQRGDAGVRDSRLAKTIRSIVAADRGAWLVEGECFPMNQYPLLAGAPTINAGNLYPAEERWLDLDTGGRFPEVWNRFASGVRIDLGTTAEPAMAETNFDVFRVSAPISVLARWNVRYVLSRRNLEPLSGGGVHLHRIARSSGWYVHSVEQGDGN